MVDWFDIDDVNKGAARFDFAKLESLNGHYIRATDDAALYARLRDALPHLPKGEAFEARLTPDREKQFLTALPLLKERAKTLGDLIDGALFLLVQRPLAMDAAAEVILDREARSTLRCTSADACNAAGVVGRDHGRRGQGLRRSQRVEARQDRAAAPRRAHRQDDVARNLRSAGRARARGEPRADHRPGRPRDVRASRDRAKELAVFDALAYTCRVATKAYFNRRRSSAYPSFLPRPGPSQGRIAAMRTIGIGGQG